MQNGNIVVVGKKKVVYFMTSAFIITHQKCQNKRIPAHFHREFSDMQLKLYLLGSICLLINNNNQNLEQKRQIMKFCNKSSTNLVPCASLLANRSETGHLLIVDSFG